MLTVDQIKGTRAKPAIVGGNGHVVTFTIGTIPVHFAGDLLHVDSDGCVYAVFNTIANARSYSAFFVDCREVYYGKFPAYLLDKVH